MSRDEAYLLDMLLASRTAQEISAGVSWPEFQSNLMMQLAMFQLIQQIGEAAANLSAEQRTRLAVLPLRKMVGLRNLLVHRYWDIDLAQIWDIVQNSVPTLIATIEPLVTPEER